MKDGKYCLKSTFVFIVLHRVYWDTTPVVLHTDASILVDDYLDMGTVSCECFIDGVIHHLIHQVVKTTAIGRSDIHRRSFSDRFKTP